eukprot:TRINITY_DN32629_c0_g1_i1.p1 TRINITY_DN32629_c0_g1~~TRINITY_DN32629_c0_g1_i1.p1  ORF type:complete len:536 (+),score=36.31 TRINITY_DN32629_c0_g1_i1:59-1609(+)
MRNSRVHDMLLTFSRADAHLLRGIRLNILLSRGAKSYAKSAGTEFSYQLSETVEKLRAFISHNWSVGRFSKFITLVLHFHMNIGILASVVVVLSFAAYYSAYPEGRTITCHATTAPVFVLFVFFASDIKRLLGFGGPTCFLDKTCIHQTDAALQRQGILKLGAFVNVSEKFIVLYSDVYLKKLWTVYEMACWLIIHETRGMTVLPIERGWFILFVLLQIYVVRLALYVATVLGYGVSFAYENVITSWIFYVISAFVIRAWKRKMAVMRKTVSQFKVRDALCQVPVDREIIFRNIDLLMKDKGMVDVEASQGDSLDTFDEFVREHVLRALETSLGTRMLSIHEILLLCFYFAIPFRVDISIAEWKVWTLPEVLIDFLDAVGMIFGGGPLMYMIVDYVVGRCMHLSGWREALYTFCFGFVGAHVISSLVYGLFAFIPISWQFQHRLIFRLVFNVILSFVALWASRDDWSRTRGKFGSESDETRADRDEFVVGRTQNLDQLDDLAHAADPEWQECVVDL